MGQQVNVYNQLRMHNTAIVDPMPIGSYQGTFEESATQNYRLGARRVHANGRVYHYGYFSAAVTYNTVGVTNTGAFDLGWSNSYDTAQPAGTRWLKVDGTSDGVPAANALADGTCMVWASTVIGRTQIGILSNLAAESSGDFTIAIELEEPMPVATAANTAVEVYANQYAAMKSAWPSGGGDGNWEAIVGMPPRMFTAEYYGWVLTWGKCFVTNSGTETGKASNDRTMVWVSDGTVIPADEAFYGQTSNQIAGYALNATSSGNADQTLMLMIDP